MKLGEMTLARPPNILLYGPVGCGKTALALTLGERAQIADMDDGLKTGLSLKDSMYNMRTQVDVRQFLETNLPKTAVAFRGFKSFVYGLPADIQAKRWPFQALIIDSLTTWADAATKYIMSNGGRIDDAPEIQHWGLSFNEITNVLGVIRTLPVPVILIAHEQVKSIGKGLNAEEKLEIAVSGKNLPSKITRYFDEVWYMKAKPAGAGKMQYVVQTVSDDKKIARSRGCLPDNTDTSCGMWELLKRVGYVPPEVKNDVTK